MKELDINNYLKSKVDDISLEDQFRLNDIRKNVLYKKNKKESTNWFVKLSYGLAFVIPLFIFNINFETNLNYDMSIVEKALSKTSVYEITDIEYDSILAFSDYNINIDEFYY